MRKVKKAVPVLKQSACLGNLDAMYMLSVIFNNGISVRSNEIQVGSLLSIVLNSAHLCIIHTFFFYMYSETNYVYSISITSIIINWTIKKLIDWLDLNTNQSINHLTVQLMIIDVIAPHPRKAKRGIWKCRVVRQLVRPRYGVSALRFLFDDQLISNIHTSIILGISSLSAKLGKIRRNVIVTNAI